MARRRIHRDRSLKAGTGTAPRRAAQAIRAAGPACASPRHRIRVDTSGRKAPGLCRQDPALPQEPPTLRQRPRRAGATATSRAHNQRGGLHRMGIVHAGLALIAALSRPVLSGAMLSAPMPSRATFSWAAFPRRCPAPRGRHSSVTVLLHGRRGSSARRSGSTPHCRRSALHMLRSSMRRQPTRTRPRGPQIRPPYSPERRGNTQPGRRKWQV